MGLQKSTKKDTKQGKGIEGYAWEGCCNFNKADFYKRGDTKELNTVDLNNKTAGREMETNGVIVPFYHTGHAL